MIVSTQVRRAVPLALAALALVGCGETPTAPSSAARVEPDGPAASRSGGHRVQRLKAHKTYDRDSENTVYTFTVDPTVTQLVTFGQHSVWLPAGVICDPTTSSYGAGEWDKPCQLATSPITFRAISGKRQGHAAVEFEPDVRFVTPDGAPWRWVILTLRDTKEVQDHKAYSILWWDAEAESNSGIGSDAKGAWVDEAALDPSLRAWTDRLGNKVSRRLKHFSGYNVTSGRSGDRGGRGGRR